jgi:hypothetical protein
MNEPHTIRSTTATHVDATAVNTIAWLAEASTSIVVPVYQRQYRWDIGGCEQLLADIRAVSRDEHRHAHFIGSILSAQDDGKAKGELVLIDGQQRITTLMLLIAALQHTIRVQDPELAAELGRVLVQPDDPAHTKLRPHTAWAEVFESVVLDRRGEDAGVSRFDDNYAFFRSQISIAEAPRIWRGLQKLEHVSITLGQDANAQQIFESLNSTGAPLKDHELIHNYVLMGLSHAEQTEIEQTYWLPIERNVGESIGAFWRHLLVMTTGREVDAASGRGVYDAFRQEFPRLDLETLRGHAHEWREYSDVYGILLDPSRAPDREIARHLGYANTFGRSTYPLVMRAYRDHARGEVSRNGLIATLEQVQSLFLRRSVVGVTTHRLIARLCRARLTGRDALAHALARITPSDERVRAALKYGALPHPAYVLGRLSGADDPTGLDVDHVLPLAPPADWNGDGERRWADYTEDEQNSHRALAETLGNLVLLEEPLAMRALDASYPAKRDTIYPRSGLAATREVDDPIWNTAAIAARTARLTDDVVRLWQRAADVDIDDDGLTPVLDAKHRRGWPAGWQREFDYVEYRGEHWEVHDVRHLFHRVFTRLWADSRASVEVFSAGRGGPIYPARAWNGSWDALDDDNFLYLGWDAHYMLTAIQGVLDEAGLAAEVFVKYSYIGAAM